MKTIALVAHNEKKSTLLEWAKVNKEFLLKHKLIGTSNTAKIINSVLDLDIEPFGHGPNGGDILLAAKILQKEVDKVVFLIDAENPHGHEHDIQTLIRTCVINEVPLALNIATANSFINDSL
ncbi:MAG: methylglyoxal synthase [Marinifilaceae bacterium]|jgi:methylglyoxal synthase|nr:methylglyoxal synthase [Marinifilaceae bacterium]